jgi:hypothetical protein
MRANKKIFRKILTFDYVRKNRSLLKEKSFLNERLQLTNQTNSNQKGSPYRLQKWRTHRSNINQTEITLYSNLNFNTFFLFINPLKYL